MNENVRDKNVDREESGEAIHERITVSFDYGLVERFLKSFLKWGLVLLFFTIPLVFYPWNTYFHVTKEFFAEMIVLTLVGIWSIWLLRKKAVDLLKSRLTLPILGFIGAIILSFSNATNLYKALIGVGIWGSYIFAFFLIISLVDDLKWTNILLFASVFAGFLAGFYLIFQFYGVDFYFWAQRGGRMGRFTTFGNPNYAAGYISGLIPLVFVYLVGIWEKKWLKGVAFVTFLVLYTALLLSYFSGAWIALIVAGVITLGVLYWQEGFEIFKCNRYWLIGLIVAVLAITVIYSTPNALNQMDESVAGKGVSTFDTSQGAVTQRVLQWLGAIQMGKREPVLGVGIGNYGVNYPEAQGRVLSQKRFQFLIPQAAKSINAHNDILHMWAETGIVGILALAWVVVQFYWGGWKIIQEARSRDRLLMIAMMGGSLSILALTLISFPFHVIPTGLLFWLFMGLTVVIGRKVRGKSLDWSNLSWQKIGWKWGGLRVALVALTIVAVVFSTSARVGPYRADLLIKRGRSIMNAGHPEPALVSLTKAANIDPGRGLVWASIGKAYLQLEKYDRAIPALKRSENNWIHQRSYNYLGTCYFRTGQNQKAIEAYKKNIFRFPNYPVAYNNLGGVYRSEASAELNQGNYSKADKFVNNSIINYEQSKVFGRIKAVPNQIPLITGKIGLNASKDSISRFINNKSDITFSFYNKGQGPRADFIQPPAEEGQPIYLKLFYHVPWSGSFQGGALLINDKSGNKVAELALYGGDNVVSSYIEKGLSAGRYPVKAMIQYGEERLAINGELTVSSAGDSK